MPPVDRENIMKRLILLALLIALVPALGTGCFFKRGGSDTGAAATGLVPTRVVRDTNVVPDSVVASRLPGGEVRVTWKTKSPAAGGYALAANLFFEERPLYSGYGKEAAAEPTLEHEAVVTGIPDGKAKVAVAYGENELTDNSGLGYGVAE